MPVNLFIQHSAWPTVEKENKVLNFQLLFLSNIDLETHHYLSCIAFAAYRCAIVESFFEFLWKGLRAVSFCPVLYSLSVRIL